MGCRCCKMLQSYLFDPVQVPSPGYVNEVNSCKLDEDDAVKLKGKQSEEVLVHKDALASEVSKRPGSGSRTSAPQEPCGPPRGPLLPADTAGVPCAEKAGGAANGLGPAAALQLTGDPGCPQGYRVSWASAANKGHATQTFLEGGSAREPDCVLLASGETCVIGKRDPNASSAAGHPAWDVPDHVLQIPAPDYPQPCCSAEDNADHVDHEEKHCLFQMSHTEEEPPQGARPRAREQCLNMPFSGKRSWDALNEAVATEVLNVYFKEEDPAQDVPVVASRNGWEETHSSPGHASRETADEDAEVAEALAALEAATAGEDEDEAA
ncbi:uncharacterized protein C4orf19 homolog [Hippopotamus amphibius kiboko]|uniref:uncharacterized protein C4orf19 homolog n=1 Tax=Hippopotamus amphibius kiboko TaxID=575201 RepID=UPI0025914BF5|nr:uncharacterized protein C4orf19 homolog [Hippopotamus amphibius kiboko]XP_057586098.1 uncharacterized protein C4orf19 homolog [Hippopotamus amphibius kiboko]XP_057586099.1 uncharacterized protein C4orf19 homolog [Hippopotamus amphibius kiboko]XP_057586100.1 uncharacterized protein C4orf19 homolog [Hippopotamus amphibius kiboko]